MRDSPRRIRATLCYRPSEMPRPDRRFAILASVLYLTVGVAAWALGPALSVGAIATTSSTMPALWAAAAILVVLAHLDLASRRLEWLMPAVVGPVALYPLTWVPGTAPATLLAVLWPLSAMPLGLVLASGAPWHARRLLVVVPVATGVAILVGLIPRLAGGAAAELVDPVRSLAVLSIVAFPALARVAMADVRDGSRPEMIRDGVERSPAQINERLTLLIAAAAPALAGTILVADWEVGLASVVVATAVLVVVVPSNGTLPSQRVKRNGPDSPRTSMMARCKTCSFLPADSMTLAIRTERRWHARSVPIFGIFRPTFACRSLTTWAWDPHSNGSVAGCDG